MGERLGIVQRIILSKEAELTGSAALEGVTTACRLKISRGCSKRWTDCLSSSGYSIHRSTSSCHHGSSSRQKRRERAEKGRDTDEGLARLEGGIAVGRWEEHNPMLGLRGVRLGLIVPELYRIQVGGSLGSAAASPPEPVAITRAWRSWFPWSRRPRSSAGSRR